MSSPTSPLPTIAVTGQFVTLANRPAEGYVTLTPVAPVAGAGWIVVGATVEALVRNGKLATTIIADSSELSADLYVRVVERINDTAANSYIVRPEGATLDLITAPRTGNPPPGQLYVPATALGQPNGVATLGADGLLTAVQRPPSSGGPGVTDHGALSGLGDDDHPQYLTQGRGDLRYPTQAALDTALAGKASALHAHAASQIIDLVAAVDARIAPIVGGPPAGLKTLEELAGAVGNDPFFAANTATALAARQQHSAELTTIAGLLASNDDVLQRKFGSWAAQSLGQFKADLALTYEDLTGTVPSSALSPLLINDVFVVASEAAMLALTAQRGDMAIRSDTGRTFVLATDNPAALVSWKEVLAAGQVFSVAGKTGVVALTKSDVGLSQADNTADVDKPASAATLALLDGKVSLSLIDAKADLLVGTADATLTRLPAGTQRQVLAVDAAAATGLAWVDPPAEGLAFDPVATRYGCKAISFDPHDISWKTPQFIAMSNSRLYAYWVPLPQGTVVTGLRMPVQAAGAGPGELHFTLYQDDLSQLGGTGDVAATFVNPAIATTWINVALAAAAASTGPGVWITALSTLAAGPQMVFCNTDGVDGIPPWLLNPASHLTALRTEGVASPPAAYAPGSATPYIDFLIGVY